MGSQIDAQDEYTVLITGFRPFKEAYPVNPSWELARRLPSFLPPSPPSTEPDVPALPAIRILVHPEPVRVNYQAVRSLVPKLWGLDSAVSSSHSGTSTGPDVVPSPLSEASPITEGSSPAAQRIDLCIHIGMAGPKMFYCIEHRGHRDGYVMPDFDGELLNDEERHRRQGDDWIWAGLPPELETDLDVRDVLKRWRRQSPKTCDLRISEDAGHFLCDFIYYSSLAHLQRNHQRRRVLFLHVPCEASDEAVAQGTELVVGLVRAAAESELRSPEEKGARAVELKV